MAEGPEDMRLELGFLPLSLSLQNRRMKRRRRTEGRFIPSRLYNGLPLSGNTEREREREREREGDWRGRHNSHGNEIKCVCTIYRVCVCVCSLSAVSSNEISAY